nr:MAG TPA: hypothetical protein [Caudoviricetes sp.]
MGRPCLALRERGNHEDHLLQAPVAVGDYPAR